MKKNSLLEKKLLQKVKTLQSSPKNYYEGRRRWGGAFPDNILLFSRTHRSNLDSQHLSSYFHHRWVLLVAMQGDGVIQVDRVARVLTAGTVLLIPPLHLHHYHDVKAGNLAWLYITFDWPGQTAPGSDELGPHVLTEESLAYLLRICQWWYDDHACAGTLLSAELMSVLLTLFPSIANHSDAALVDTQEKPIVSAVRREVSSQSGDMLSISELARRIGISPSHLRAEFRAHTGISLGRYLREWRLREAALLLSSENLSVKETAERLGFRDIYAFSRAFSHALGVPPSSLRTRNASKSFAKGD